MPFDQSTITDVRAVQSGTDLLIIWTSSAAAGTHFQVYADRRLVWHGVGRSASIPTPLTRSKVDVGAVLATEAGRDLAAELPAVGWSDRAELTWIGGAYQGTTLAGFRVYAGTAPGGAVSYTSPVATIRAFAGNAVTGGYGLGGYGLGGYGEGSGSYRWRSGPLAGGTWNFAVVPFDAAGNEGTGTTTAVVVTAPPAPPAADANGRRLTVSAFDSGTGIPTLSWLASPG